MKKLILIALAISLIIGFGVYSFAKTLESRTNVETMPVVVAVEKIPKNTVIEASMITTKPFPKEYIHEYSTGKVDDIIGRITLESIEADEQILSTRLIDSSNNSNNLSFSIPQNYRAISVLTDEVSGVAGYISPGDRVDLVAVILNKATGVESQMVAENLEVAEVGDKGNDGKKLYTAVTVLVPDQDVVKVSYALSEGKYRLVLRSLVDEKIVNPAPYVQ
ncbi:Flp pilus assembly protein CpaB [Acetobacterium sp.]|uniref:Flp pilus assembly protein CpaB n=1 Tax=Acetobacterium sp. TaxID=1872094 RepID=UPI002F3E33E1